MSTEPAAPVIPGHGLCHEGAVHDAHGNRVWKPFGGVGGTGRGKCACGAMSETLPSAYQRKAWHREHRRQVAAEGLSVACADLIASCRNRRDT